MSLVSVFALVMLTMSGILLMPKTSIAASVTSFQVLLTREKAAQAGNQTVMFTVPTAIADSETIILTYDNSTSIHASLDHTDIDFSVDATPDFVCETGDTEFTVAAAPGGASTVGAVRTSGTVLTFTNGTSNTIASGSEICIQIGTHATFTATGDQQITNGSAGSSTLVLSGTMGTPDITGTAAMSIIADDQVVITATVAPSITFTISDNTIEFGTLSSSAAKWADDSAGDTSDAVAHTMTVATNATGGYIVSYNGATLTSGSDTIDVANGAGNTLDDANGDPGTEQFGLSIATNGDATITTNYAYAGTPDWHWVASTTSTIISETVPTATETFSAHYLANISGTTEAGAYSTTVNYIATATF